MNRNELHIAVEPGTPLWITINLSLLVAGAVIFFIAWRYPARHHRIRLAKFLGVLMALTFVVNHGYHAYTGSWTLKDNLPLHLCGISNMLAIVVLFTRKQALYEFLIFWGAGAIHAFLTPELTRGDAPFEVVEYIISHGGIVVAGLFCTLFLHLKPRQKSWLRVFLFTQLFLPLVGLVNYLFDANYMYLAQRPDAQNPFIIGDWPWYIIGLEVALLLHIAIFYKVHSWLAKKVGGV